MTNFYDSLFLGFYNISDPQCEYRKAQNCEMEDVLNYKENIHSKNMLKKYSKIEGSARYGTAKSVYYNSQKND